MLKFWKKELSNISDKATIGEGSIIHSGVHIHDEVIIGKNCKIEALAFLPNGVTLEDDVFVGPGVIFTNDKTLTEPFVISKTLVQQGAKIGAGAMIRAGVIIGREAVIGMGSVVIDNVPHGHVVVGNPAKVIKVKQDFHWYE